MNKSCLSKLKISKALIAIALSFLLASLGGCSGPSVQPENRQPALSGSSPKPRKAVWQRSHHYSEVLTGIDVLQQQNFAALAGHSVGLITNHTGMAKSGVSTAALLHSAPDVKLVALFSPEHGLEGKLDIAEISDTVDEDTRIPVYSLYGETRKPTTEMLQGIDTLIFDIQDIGTRFYTYISTMGNALEVAAEHNIRFMVLDRPNPINGVDVGGPMLDEGKQSFVAHHILPVRHGMTVGELAMMFNAELGLNADLQIIRMQNWDWTGFYSETGLRWINPSPNMRNLTQALLYPGIGLLETTNLSVGRGTDTPFEVIGAPWLDGDRLARQLNLGNLPGVAFIPVVFTPDASKFAGQECNGINILITDRAQFEPLTTGLEIARMLRQDYPVAWDIQPYIKLLGNASVWQLIHDGQSLEDIRQAFTADLLQFIDRRSQFLIYP